MKVIDNSAKIVVFVQRWEVLPSKNEVNRYS